MKTLALIMTLAFSSVSFAEIDSKAISAAYTKLSKIGYASNAYKVKPGSPYSMIKQLALNEYGDDEFHFEKDVTPEADGRVWGTIEMRQAMGFVRSAEGLSSTRIEKGLDAIRSLVGSGVVFGVNPHGAVQCGISLPALLLIDTEAGKIYSVSFDPSGPC
ncbi:MAG: hypothetical protein AB7O96_06170 [Pseudobdellovibrionaceae bacterium]